MISQQAFSFAADIPIADTLTVRGETRYIVEWAKIAGISEDTLRKRLAAEWEPEEAVTKPKALTNRAVVLRGHVPDGAPGSSTWYDLPWEKDTWAQEFVAAHPDGASLEQVGDAMGVKVSWVCEMEQNALAKLLEKLKRVRRGVFDSLRSGGQLALVGDRKDEASIDLGAWTMAELVRFLLDDEELDEAERVLAGEAKQQQAARPEIELCDETVDLEEGEDGVWDAALDEDEHVIETDWLDGDDDE